jgi:hypothetical protein
MNTGTPIAEKCSASVCRVTVLPVPVAPVMRPWRLASCRQQGEFVFAGFRDDERLGHDVPLP